MATSSMMYRIMLRIVYNYIDHEKYSDDISHFNFRLPVKFLFKFPLDLF